MEDLNEIRRLSDLLFAHHESKDGPAYPLAQGYIALENDQYEEAKVFFQDGLLLQKYNYKAALCCYMSCYVHRLLLCNLT